MGEDYLPWLFYVTLISHFLFGKPPPLSDTTSGNSSYFMPLLQQPPYVQTGAPATDHIPSHNPDALSP